MSSLKPEPPPYEMVDVRLGHVVFEHDVQTQRVRLFFSDEAVVPKDEYFEGKALWKYQGTAQALRFAVRDRRTGEVVPFDELLALVYYPTCKRGSAVHQIGELAHELDISIYVALTYEDADGKRLELSPSKLRMLNRLFNDRLRTPGKKVLIVPDAFALYQEVAYGDMMLDFGLTSLEAEH